MLRNQLSQITCLFIILLVLFTSSMEAQLQTTGGQTPTQLVQNNLAGYGIQIISVSFQGSSVAYGSFNGSSSNIGLSSGVVMTTGIISGAGGPVGPNDQPNAGLDNGSPGYALFAGMVSPSQTYNATVFNITFIPQGDSIFLKYVLGSEEFPEYVGSNFKDVIGFFLSGPNPGGGEYLNQNLDSNSYAVIDNSSGTTVQYDGFTMPLVIRAGVIPDSTYTLKIAIADVGNAVYDSGLFMEASSFTSGTWIGIEEPLSAAFSIFPVPANDHIQINTFNNEIIKDICISDGLGRTVIRQNIEAPSAWMDVSHLETGLYIITIHTCKEKFTRKIIVN